MRFSAAIQFPPRASHAPVERPVGGDEWWMAATPLDTVDAPAEEELGELDQRVRQSGEW